ncbi:hypothetical protein AQZ52_05165 [Novosphingobium fuchskuhlense]|uniref:Calcium-binding protein n=1 Tax=Novosphingobium fuchskuhlense TaxID=1117702 RepID=A0A117UXF0_9SPHN|nr:calcium-binding protein [Novosphingobium fuchskuhlense]KUR72631.1 hypothetical protein AQZ52_05165 [Novosphingobium fuchskuhlense]
MANIAGTANADTLDGTAQNDVIDGLGADDVIRTAGGLDTVHGGDGNDRIGANYFDGFSGTLYGDAGNDLILATAYRGATTVSGGSGDDRLYLGFYSSYSANTLTGTGGEGNDLVVLGSAGTVDLGAGDDRFISQAGSAQTVTLGAGRDEVVLGFRGLGSTDLSTTTTFDFGSGTSNLTITDFKPGEDRMTFNLKQAWSAASANPFADGYWRLEQRGADAVLEYDTTYGSGLAASYTDYITFKNLDATLLTAADLDGFDPHGALPTGKVITGTAASEGGPSDLMLRAAGLVGSNGADKIYGNGGNDDLFGRGGNDALIGGSGDDNLFGGLGIDVLQGGTGNDYLEAGSENDRAYGGAGNDTLVGVLADGHTALIDGGSGADTLFGAGGRDILLGGTGNDRIDGGLGNDALYGGQGADTFVFSTAPGPANIDSMADFSSPLGDRLSLKASAFAGIGAVGALSADAFYAAAGASAAHDANDRIIYDTASGTLRFDADGTGTAAAITLAVLKGAPLLAATDLLVF